MDVHVGDWSFGDDERELPRATEPSDEDTAGFWAKSVTRTQKVWASALLLCVVGFVAWHGYEIALGVYRLVR